MRVRLIASTWLDTDFWQTDYELHRDDDGQLTETDADELLEFAGRGCYKAYNRPNPATATNEAYLGNILDQGHESVLEHASFSFYVEGVSRALLLELERHRFLSFSVESQRYVDTAKHHPYPVIPPTMRRFPHLVEKLENNYKMALVDYYDAYNEAIEAGVSRKKAREMARAFLHESTPTDFVVSGNLRAWRSVLEKRWSTAADEEIRAFAGLILEHLKTEAPNAMQDIPTVPWGA